MEFSSNRQKAFQDFIDTRLTQPSPVCIRQPMKKLKLKTWNQKTKITTGKDNKVVKLKEERELLGRFLIIQSSRPELVPKLEDTIGKFEMSVVPRALCAVDGTLYIPTDKASLLHTIEATAPEGFVPSDASEPLSKVIVIDAMAVVQGIKKTASMKKLAHLVDAFIQRIERLIQGYESCRVIFDRYLDKSLKNYTRTKRATTSIEYDIHLEMRLTMGLKDLFVIFLIYKGKTN